jgi:hypothetical protein
LTGLTDNVRPKPKIARDAYRSAGDDVPRLIRLSTSGRDLVDGGFSGDVDLAVELEISSSVPISSMAPREAQFARYLL